MSQSQAPNPNLKISRKEAVDALWRKGVLHWKLHSGQKDMHELAKKSSHPIVVIGCSRQLGKSYCMTLLAIEECLQKPNIIVKFIAPKAKDIRRIIAPLIREITQDAPKDLKPKFNSRENIYIFANGSEIQLAGTDNGHAESIRGNKADLCIIDEAGFCDELDYVVKSILLPTMTRTRGKLIMASTPSKSPDHPFMSFYDEAEVEQRLIKKTIYDNPHLTAEDIDKIALALGGKDSIDFRREYLVERIIDENDAVVPEFNIALQDKVIKEVVRPAFYDNYVSMDIGGRDLTAVVFGYYDFANARIVIEDEYISSKQVLTDEIALNIKNKEKFLWTGKTGEVKTPTLRVADNNNIILLNDLSVKHDLQFIPTLKDNADAQINNMRLLLKAEKIIINPRCVTLISHLKSAIWNKSRTSFARDATKGHFDMIHALVYFCRNVNMNKNPFPAGYAFAGLSSVFYSDPEIKTKETQVETKFKEMFTVKNPRKIRRY